jgi:hypothetical protein
MKRIQEVIQTQVDGLDKLLGENVEVYCLNYIYAGKLIGVNDQDICLGACVLVYETGTLSDHSGYTLVESFGVAERFIRKSVIESYGLAPKYKTPK